MKCSTVESCITHIKMNYDILIFNYYSTPLIFKLLFISFWMLALSEDSCSWSSSTSLGVMTPNRNVLVGTKLEIDCTIFNTTIQFNKKSYEVNSSMIWFKFKNKYYSEDKIHLINKTVAQLSVENATLEDNGFYKCLLNVSGLCENVSGGEVKVGYKPQNVTDFKCFSFYNRKLLCSWSPQHNSVHTSYRLEDRIHVNISSKFDYQKCGNYPTENSCEWRTDTVPPFRKTVQKFYLLLTGENQFGKNQQLFVIEHNTIIKPNKPRDLTSYFLKKNNLSMSWSAPNHKVDDEHIFKHIIYEIHYFRIDSHNPNNAKIKPIIIDDIRETNITLTHLIPFNRYNVSIRCKTIKSINKEEYWSEFSSIEVETKSDVPYFAPVLIPESFEAVETFEGNRSITLYWKSIPIENHNAIGFHYSIKYRQMSGEKYEADNNVYDHTVIVKSEYTNHTFKLMDLNTAYNFKIYGVNDEGMSKNFSEITIYENEYMPYKPTNINGFSYGGGRYELQWEQLKDNPNSGSTVNYTVFWCQTLSPRSFPCEGVIDWAQTTNTSIELELPDIISNYKFAVSANALNSSSGITWAECMVPFDGRLEKLSEVRLEVLNLTSINVNWKLNCPAQERLFKGYKIDYCKVEDILIRNICYSKTFNKSESFTLNGLNPNFEYKISVVALTSSGETEGSNPKYVIIIPGQMNRPRIDYLNATFVRISWSPPKPPNSPIDYYLLKQIWRNDKTESVVHIPSDQKEYNLSLDCNSYGDEFAVSIVAVNNVKNEDLFGDYSESTNFIACHQNKSYIIAILVGILSFVPFVIVLYMSMRWIKRKINTYNNLAIELPKSLEKPLWLGISYDGNRDQSFENRHDSEISYVSSSSNDGLNYRNQSNNTFFQVLGTDREQHESVSLAFYDEEQQSFGLRFKTHIQSNHKYNNDLKRVNKLDSDLLPLDKISPQKSDSSITEDSYLDLNSNGNSKRTGSNSISTNHKTSIDSKLANSEPSFYNLLEEENLTQTYKPEITKCLSDIIENLCNSAPQINCIFCDSNKNCSKSSTRTAPEKNIETKLNNGFVKMDTILRNSHNKRTDIINQLNLSDVSTHFTECEEIQSKSLNEFKDKGEQNEINSSVNPSIISIKEMFSNSNAVECIPALNETKSLSTSSNESIESKESPNHLLINSKGYVLHNALTQSSSNNVKLNLTKNTNGYVVVNES